MVPREVPSSWHRYNYKINTAAILILYLDWEWIRSFWVRRFPSRHCLLAQFERHFGDCWNRKPFVYLRLASQQLRHGHYRRRYYGTFSLTFTFLMKVSSAALVLMTANFKYQSIENMDALLELQPHRPILVSEFWPGWFDHWLEPVHNILNLKGTKFHWIFYDFYISGTFSLFTRKPKLNHITLLENDSKCIEIVNFWP